MSPARLGILATLSQSRQLVKHSAPALRGLNLNNGRKLRPEQRLLRTYWNTSFNQTSKGLNWQDSSARKHEDLSLISRACGGRRELPPENSLGM